MKDKVKRHMAMKASMKAAGHVDKEDFLKQLKAAWKNELKHKVIDVEHETRQVRIRINESGMSKVFDKVGVGDEDIRKVLDEIKSETPTPKR